MRKLLSRAELIHIIWFFAKFNPAWFLLVGIISFLSGLLEGVGISLFLPLILGSQDQSKVGQVISQILDGVRALGLDPTNRVILTLMVGFFFLRNITRFYEWHLRGKFEKSFIYKIKSEVLNGMFDMDFMTYQRRIQPKATALLTSEMALLAQFLYHLFQFLTNAATAVAMALAALFINPWATITGVCVGALLMPFQRKLGKMTKGLSKDLTRSIYDFTNRTQELLHLYRYMKSTHQEEAVVKSSLIVADKERVLGSKIVSLSGLAFALNQFLAVFFLSGTIVLAIDVFQQPAARVIITMGLIYRIVSMVALSLSSYQTCAGLTGSFNSVKENLELIDKSREQVGSKIISNFNSSICFKNVTLEVDDVSLIDDASFTINKGEFVAILGSTGAGKSLLVQLITGLLKPTSGQILIDGIDSNDINSSSWRNRIGYVPQDYGTMTGTFQEIITGKSGSLSVEEEKRLQFLMAQLKLSEVVSALPSGAQTLIGLGGHTLSGGQKQRLALARELYRNPEVLILDEATSALDASTQETIAFALNAFKGKVTIIMIAHRLRMAQDADCFIYIDSGRIMQTGGFELLEDYRNNVLEKSKKRNLIETSLFNNDNELLIRLPVAFEKPLKVTMLSLTGLSFENSEDLPINSEFYSGELLVSELTVKVELRILQQSGYGVDCSFENISNEANDFLEELLKSSWSDRYRKVS